MGKTPTYDPKSHLKSITYVEGLSIQRVHYLGQRIASEKSHIYRIDETSELKGGQQYIYRFTIYLINENGIVTEWRNHVVGSRDSVSYVSNTLELIET